MLFLAATDESLEVETTTTSSIDFVVSWAELSSSGLIPGTTSGNISTATTIVVIAAPSAGTQRQLKAASFVNRGTASQTVRVKLDKAGTERYLTADIPLAPDESLRYMSDFGWYVVDSSGRRKVSDAQESGTTGRKIPFFKVGTATEAAGVMYSFHKDTGFPGAWSPGTPGINGRATNGNTAADAGCLPLWTPSGTLYKTEFDAWASVANLLQLFDFLWVNTGLVVTTTTAQAITPVELPARDINGGTNGDGVEAAILVTTATTNAAAITNMTISYTNSNGVAGRTGTITSFPATAVIGSLIPFQLAAGDKGVRSVQSVTLGTTLTAGAISLVLFRRVAFQAVSLANTPSAAKNSEKPGVRLYTGSCLIPVALPSATTAINITGGISVMER